MKAAKLTDALLSLALAVLAVAVIIGLAVSFAGVIPNVW